MHICYAFEAAKILEKHKSCMFQQLGTNSSHTSSLFIKISMLHIPSKGFKFFFPLK